MSSCTDNCEGELPIEKPSFLKTPQVRASLVGWLLLGAALTLRLTQLNAIFQILLFAASIVSAAFYFAREAFAELFKKRKIGIELLMMVAIIGAAGIGQWQEAALVAALYSISEALEGFTIRRTRFAIRKLMDLVPAKAHVLRGGQEVEVDVKDVHIGEHIRIRPGESIPTDGIIIEGTSFINESAVTGESMPVERTIKTPVFAGTLNGNGSLVIEVTKAFEDNTVNTIIKLVEKAQKQKGRSQLFVEKFGRIYSPAVLLISILVAAIPFLIGLDAIFWLRRAISFLVSASPCALAVATPVTLVAAIGSAAKKGVLIKGGNILEALGKVKAVAIDKTGTLTTGKPTVTRIYAAPEQDENKILSIAASVERLSEHPLASAIVKESVQRNLKSPLAQDFKAITAAGVEGVVEGQKVLVLKPKSAIERGIIFDNQSQGWLRATEQNGQTVVVIIVNDQFVGFIALADTPRPEAVKLVSSLKAAGVQHLVMLTGDNPGTAQAVARQIGITEYYAALLPEDKVERVEELRIKYQSVAMVGDGINDSPALAAASVGIAMGTSGSDAALAAADIALVANDLSKLQYAIELGKRSRRVIAQNITLSLVIVTGLILGTFFADISMLTAVLSHEGSEVIIILNGLRVAFR